MMHHSHYLDKKTIPYLTNALSSHFLQQQPGYSEIVIVCVGSSRYPGDALGPIVGSKLARLLGQHPSVYLFGTTEKPVHALNLNKTVAHIAAKRKGAYVIAVDACLGQFYKIGTLQLVEEPLQPGSGLGKSLPAVGHIHFKGIVNNHAPLRPQILEHGSLLTFLDDMASVIAGVLVRSLQDHMIPRLVPSQLPEGGSSSDTLSAGW
ncbi:spore protease YyaC [Paenibacillus beijingensis]|uniref:spore protease YyaC n=1 Tax=Paenibacillus beijingensis TaxID=1126833 RepID=UPI0006984DE0|nr:spore protease YyaC [Paenibacillus beijingensis]